MKSEDDFDGDGFFESFAVEVSAVAIVGGSRGWKRQGTTTTARDLRNRGNANRKRFLIDICLFPSSPDLVIRVVPLCTFKT